VNNSFPWAFEPLRRKRTSVAARGGSAAAAAIGSKIEGGGAEHLIRRTLGVVSVSPIQPRAHSSGS
jgi:hypothetical protein